MKLLKLTATFGCLDGAVLELKDGLNILELPNESGKSTWCAFLRVMLYGLSTRERDKKGFLADKSRYQPWSGKAMEGELRCLWQDREIVVRRYTRDGVPMGGFEAVYADSGAAVPGLTADNLGDVLIGVSRPVFERSAFLSQNGHEVSYAPELEKRLSSLVTAGEEGVAATQVKTTLTDWQRRRSYRGRGSIPTLTERRDGLSVDLDRIQDETAAIRRTRLEIDKLEALRAKLQHQVDLHRAHADDAQAKAWTEANTALEEARGQLDRLLSQLPASGELPPKADLERGRDEVAYLRTLDTNLKMAAKQIPEAEQALAQAREAAADPVYSGTAAEARAMANEAVTGYDALAAKRRSAGRNCWLIPCLCILLGGALAAVAWFQAPELLLYAAIAAGTLVALGVVVGLVSLVKKNKRGKEMAAILERFGVSSTTELTSNAESYCERLAELERKEDEYNRVVRAEEELRGQREECWNGLRDLVVGFAPEVKDVFGFSAAITRGLTLIDAIASAEERLESTQKLFDAVDAHGSGAAYGPLEEPTLPLDKAQAGVEEVDRRIAAHQNDLSMALGRRSTLGEPEAVQSQLEQTQQVLEVHQRDFDALSIALEAMDQADAEMRERFSPELNRLAGDYLGRMTGGRYAKVRLDRDMEVCAEEQGSVAPRDVLTLSRGTADQLWLAVRLAVCELALPVENRCPIVLDDALVNFDDLRLLPALKLLGDLAQKRQILLFTCHGREGEVWQQLGREGT